MTTERRFFLPSSLARLVQSEQGVVGRVAEGHFSAKPDRIQFVRVEATACYLVLLSRTAAGATVKDRTEIPRSQAEALLDVCAGTIAYDQSKLALVPGRDVLLDRIITPKRADLLTVVFHDDSSLVFHPPEWFGPEVTDDPAYESRAIEPWRGWRQSESQPTQKAKDDDER